jgi:hypothetical protein
MDAYLLHCLNHVAKAADKIKRDNERLEQQQAKVGVYMPDYGTCVCQPDQY